MWGLSESLQIPRVLFSLSPSNIRCPSCLRSSNRLPLSRFQGSFCELAFFRAMFHLSVANVEDISTKSWSRGSGNVEDVSGTWRNYSNKKISNLYTHQTIITWITILQIRWFVCVTLHRLTFSVLRGLIPNWEEGNKDKPKFSVLSQLLWPLSVPSLFINEKQLTVSTQFATYLNSL